jgi:hypothetical protein
MLKKVLGGALLVGLIGVLIYGAFNRTADRTAMVVVAQGFGRQRSTDALNSGGGRGQGGAGNATGQRYGNSATLSEPSETVEGAVVQTPAPGTELVIVTDAGEELVIGTGLLDLAAEGFALQTDERVQVQGYWEEGEFRAVQVTRLSDGQTVAIRDGSGRPVWSGGARNGQGDGSGDQTGTGQAQVDAWLDIAGTAVSVGTNALVVRTAEGELIAVENRAWLFAQEQGFWVQVSDELSLRGFYEEGELEVGRIDDLTSGQTVMLRDETGQPMWAGRGRRGA